MDVAQELELSTKKVSRLKRALGIPLEPREGDSKTTAWRRAKEENSIPHKRGGKMRADSVSTLISLFWPQVNLILTKTPLVPTILQNKQFVK